MQISSNTTGLSAGLSVQTDKHGCDHCVVAIVGTYEASETGELRPAATQRPPTPCDTHYGDPETTAVAYEHDFVRYKPSTDVIVVGKAVAPGGRPVTELPIRLEVAGRIKDLVVIGEREWVDAGLELVMSPPVPFTEMPLTFDRAYGGAADLRNPIGVGSPAKAGQRLPNLEDPRRRITSPRSRAEPIGLGCVGRNAQPRLAFAGTFDAHWREHVCPLLPEDFDERHFQCAPPDQQFPRFQGGEQIRCVHMAAQPVVEYRLPGVRIPVSFNFVAGRAARMAELDTVILEPHHAVAVLVWRVSVPLGKKLTDLRGIEVGEQPTPRDGVLGYRRGKPVFAGIAATVRWLGQRRDRRGLR